jgi:shikimate kinase
MKHFIVSLIGLPGSGKSTYGKRFAAENDFVFIPEVGTMLIYEKKYKIGINAPFEFDKEIFEKNIQIANEILRFPARVVVWEGCPLSDMFWLEGRLVLGDQKMKEQRRALLDLYNMEIFQRLFENTNFVFFHVRPEISKIRQEKRNRPELSTSEEQLLNFVYEKLTNFYTLNKSKVVFIDVEDKSKDEIFEVFNSELLNAIRIGTA